MVSRSEREQADLFYADLMGMSAPPVRRSQVSPRQVPGEREAFFGDRTGEVWQVIASREATGASLVLRGDDLVVRRSHGSDGLAWICRPVSSVDRRDVYGPDGRVRADTLVLRRIQAAGRRPLSLRGASPAREAEVRQADLPAPPSRDFAPVLPLPEIDEQSRSGLERTTSPLTPDPRPPSGLALASHNHVRRTCSDGKTFTSAAAATAMSPSMMNPGFLKADDAIEFDTRLDKKLVDLIVDDADYRTAIHRDAVSKRYPDERDTLRVALVDLTGQKLCRPGYAGWGSTWPMQGGSTAKLAILYAAHQLLFDLNELSRAGNLRTATDVKSAATSGWLAMTCKPDLDWLIQFDTSSPPVKVAASINLDRHLKEMVDASFSGVSTSRAAELIMRLGFEYIASLLWQSGLRHPTRAGLWLGNLFKDVSITARANPACHAGTNPISWSKNPLGATGITLTALSAATFMTLLAQGRLVDPATSTRMETLLGSGCTFVSIPGATIRATKCGLTSSVRHDAALVENGARRYVLVVLTKNSPWSASVRDRFIRDLDKLIKDNNP